MFWALLVLGAAIAAIAWGLRNLSRPEGPVAQQDESPPTPVTASDVTSYQLDMLVYARKCGGVEIANRGGFDYEVGQVATPAESRAVRTLAKRGLLREVSPRLYRLTPEGQKALHNAGY